MFIFKSFFNGIALFFTGLAASVFNLIAPAPAPQVPLIEDPAPMVIAGEMRCDNCKLTLKEFTEATTSDSDSDLGSIPIKISHEIKEKYLYSPGTSSIVNLIEVSQPLPQIELPEINPNIITTPQDNYLTATILQDSPIPPATVEIPPTTISQEPPKVESDPLSFTVIMEIKQSDTFFKVTPTDIEYDFEFITFRGPLKAILEMQERGRNRRPPGQNSGQIQYRFCEDLNMLYQKAQSIDYPYVCPVPLALPTDKDGNKDLSKDADGLFYVSWSSVTWNGDKTWTGIDPDMSFPAGIEIYAYKAKERKIGQVFEYLKKD